MSLTNAQYDAIQREYDARQLKNRRLLETRRAEVFRACPAYEEASDQVASLSVAYGKRLLDGEEGALSPPTIWNPLMTVRNAGIPVT